MVGGRDEVVLSERVPARTHPGVALIGVLAGGLLAVLLDGPMRVVGIVAVPVSIGVALFGTLRYEWGTSEDGEPLFRVVRWWGARTVPMADLREVRMGGALSTRPTASVKFEGVQRFTLDLTWSSHAQLVHLLRSHLGPLPPSYDPARGVVRIDALAQLRSDHCLRCGSTTFVRPIRVHAQRGIHLVVFSTWSRRWFELPVCVYHRWGRYFATHLANLSVLPMFVLVLIAWAALDEAGWDPVLTRVVQWSVVGAGVVGALAVVNELPQYLLDRLILGVRLGWLHSDHEHSRLVIGSDRIREAIEAHLRTSPATPGKAEHGTSML